MADTTDDEAGTSDLGSQLASLLGTGAEAGINQNMLDDLDNASITDLQEYAAQLANQGYPDLANTINQKVTAQAAGVTPAQMQAAQQQATEMEGVTQPAVDTNAVNTSLGQEEQIAQEGYTPQQRAAYENAIQSIVNQEQGETGAIEAGQQARGQYGGGQQLDLQQQALQGETNNAANQMNEQEANSFAQALQAVNNEGTLGLSAGNQGFNQQAQIAQAQDAINQYNTSLEQQANQQNASNEQAANLQSSSQQQQTNLANQQAELELNQQNEAAANQNITNQQNQESLASGLMKQSGSDAASMMPSVYNNTTAQEGSILGSATNASSPVGSALSSGLNDLFSGGSTLSNMLSGSSLGENDIGNITADNSSEVNDALDSTNFSSDLGSEADSLGSDIGSLSFAKGGKVDLKAILDHVNGTDCYSDGGNVIGPGTGTSDDIPVRLSNGEYVINADSAAKYPGLVKAINDDDEGGIVDQVLSRLMPSDGADEKTTIVLGSPKGKSSKEGQRALQDALRAMASLADN